MNADAVCLQACIAQGVQTLLLKSFLEGVFYALPPCVRAKKSNVCTAETVP